MEDRPLRPIDNGKLWIAEQQCRIQRAQRRAQKYLKSGTSLVEELLAERRDVRKNA